MNQVFDLEMLLTFLGWGLVLLLRLLVPLVMLGAAIWAARRLPVGIGSALILGTSVTLLCAIASALLFSPVGMNLVDLGAASFRYISTALQVVAAVGGLFFAGGFIALAIWLPERNGSGNQD